MIQTSLLERIPFFRDFSQGDLEEIVLHSDAQLLKIPPNQTILNEGDMGQTCYILLRGKAVIYKRPFSNPLSWLKPGQVFGEVSFLTPRVRVTSVVAEEECIVLQFDKAFLQDLSPDCRDKFKDQMIITLVKNLDSLREVIEEYKAPVVIEHRNPFSDYKDAEGKEVKEELCYEDDEGFKIINLGRRKVRLEKDGKSTEVELVPLTTNMPGKFLNILKSQGKDPEDYLFGKDFLIPRRAESAWKRMLVAEDSKKLKMEREMKSYLEKDGVPGAL
ncbi:MAG: cyclic nucleotide-binding domain-containing protein [Magnetococcales bacterium]|nr:cyclic nucleotide-binding domain-containing protein [Magnetococcales bacterium]